MSDDDVLLAFRFFGPLSAAGVRRVWLRADLYDRFLALFSVAPSFAPSCRGVTVYKQRDWPAVFPCGCSKDKVRAGLCIVYRPRDGEPRQS